MTTIRRDLEAQLARIIGNVRVIRDEDTLGHPVRCLRCRDTGLVEYTGGTHVTLGAEPRRQGQKITATEQHPVYKQCGCQPATQEPAAARRRLSAA